MRRREHERLQAAACLLPHAVIGAVPAGGRISRPGAPAAREPRHVSRLPRGHRKRHGTRRALPHRGGADAGGRRPQARAGATRVPARMRRDREVPCAMASLGPRTLQDTVRVRFSDERPAIALAQELIGLVRVDVTAVDSAWEVAIDGVVDDHLVGRVLDAVRSSLGDDLGAVATVMLDGREYRLYGAPPNP